jgi:hypothetical protein
MGLRERLGEEVFNAAWRRGEALDVEEEFEKEFREYLEGSDD